MREVTIGCSVIVALAALLYGLKIVLVGGSNLMLASDQFPDPEPAPIGCWSRERNDQTGDVWVWRMRDGSIAYGTHFAPALGCGAAYADSIELGGIISAWEATP